jgi:two-component system CheB/CheR fusion protein
LRELCEDVRVVMAARVSELRQRLELAADLERYTVDADRELLRRVLQNLVDNGAKHGPSQGVIRLEAHAHSPGWVLIRVRDEGPGVAPGLRERIFDKYAHEDAASFRQRDGRGLGLRFCQMAVRLHGGSIWVEDSAPRGAAFCVLLPAPSR